MPYEAKTNWKYDDTVTEKDLNRIEQGLKDAHVAENKDITLQPGVQIVDVPEDTPFRMGEIRGRTLINLLGRAGRCDDTKLWGMWQASLDRGSAFKGICVDVMDGFNDGAAFFLINNVKHGRSFIIVGNAEHNENAQGARFGATFYTGDKVVDNTVVSKKTSETSVRQPIHLVFTIPSGVDSFTVNMGVVANEAKARGYFDSIRVYEIPSSEVVRLTSMKSEDVAELYPYTESITNVTNPYAIATSGNLLPVLYEHDSMSLNGAKVDLQGAYKGRVVTDKSTQFLGWANISVKPNTTYSIKAERASTITKMYVNEQPAVGIPHTKQHTFNPLQGGTFTTKNDTNVIGVYFGNHDAVGEIAFENPVLSPTTEQQQPFAPQSRSMWAVESQLAADPVEGTNMDVLYVGDDGLPYVLEKWAKVTINDTFTWSVNAAVSGLKQLGTQLKIPYNPDTWSPTCVKFDGSILSRSGEKPDVLTGSQDGKSVYIQVSSKDSGWGDKYTPTDDEIKAYFLGWRMCQQETAGLYNGTGTRCWGRITDPANVIGQAGWNATTTLPTGYAGTDAKGNVYKPYRLQYLKVKPTVEPVVNYETGLTLLKGWNMVEVDSGIVLREKANFVINSASTHYCANTAQGGGDTPTPFRYRTEDIFKVFKNQTAYVQWEKNIFSPFGKYRAIIAKEYYDPTAVYHVTYTMLDPTLSATISGSIATNLRGTVTDVVQWASDAERRLSVVEIGDGSHESLDSITPESIGAAKKTDLDILTKHSVAIKNNASKDLNTYRDPGMYFIGALNEYANAPSTDGGFSWGILRVETLGTTAYVVQSYTCVLNNVTFTRSKAEDSTGRGWEPWRATAKLDTDGVLRLSKWLDIRADGPSINLYSSTHVYQQFIVKEKRVGYIGVGDPGAPQNMLLASDNGDVRLWAGNGGVFINDRNVLYEIDQLKQSGVNNKQALVDALNAKGIAASINEDWGTLVSKVQQTSYMRSVNLDRESEIRESNSTFEHIYTIPAGVKRIIFTSSSNWATQMYTSYDSPTLEIALKDANGLYRIVASNYYNNYRYRSLDVYSFVVDFTLNISRSSYRVSSSDNVYNAEGIGISNAGEIQLGFLYFTNGYYNGKGKINGTLQYE
ncbi:pyocin knob domain-containing protein [Paenibacillus alvei]|uniref:pyocin knob domain-containing protein n=1 Tax=Paenibacillus alvei TaxID=44250 RepID=UPI0018CEDC75|nr:pyocin knob domain-containing protein [Paenibacillus alvei]MBG9737255.1 hypothetical protein [Paenibacillus alvei]MBG9746349.1 hypothetical protein [Paenibacillus alvei]MCY9581707.1 pyocin knob domain-containing protein [Paenibacillus alvei]MCY9586166.1 pyocin knob domain-containing protein [Paenibacillus alvei]